MANETSAPASPAPSTAIEGLALLAEIAPGTASIVAVTGGSAEANIARGLSEIHRANAILGAYIDGLGDNDADSRFVLWTVQAILRDARAIIESEREAAVALLTRGVRV